MELEYLYVSLGAGSSLIGTAGAWTNTSLVGVTEQVNLVGTSGATFYITGVQLEAGSVATPFEHRQYGQELALCQRYFLPVVRLANESVGLGQARSTTVAELYIRHPVEMRTAGTLSFSALSDFLLLNSSAGSAGEAVSITIAVGTPNMTRIDCGVAANLVAGIATTMQAANSSARLSLSAEL